MTSLDDLKAGMTAEQLVPGDIPGMSTMAKQIGTIADQLHDMARGIGYIQLDGKTWSGEAADVYAAARSEDIQAFKGAGVVFDDVKATIENYVSNLKSARHLAATAVSDFQKGQKKQKEDEANCATPTPPANAPAPFDPYGFNAAAAKVDAARTMVDTSASIAAPIIKKAASMAPLQTAPINGDAGGPSMKDLISAPWHMLKGAAGMAKGLYEQFETFPNAFVPPGEPLVVPPNNGQKDFSEASKEWAGGTLTTLTIAAMLYGLKGGGEVPEEAPGGGVPESSPVKVPVGRGGLAPVLKGQAGVNEVTKELETQGWEVSHEVTLKTDVNGAEVRTRVDIIARRDDGSLVAIEVKNGEGAHLTPNQEKAYPVVQSKGFVPVGKNAELAGFTSGQAHGPIPVWTVHLP